MLLPTFQLKGYLQKKKDESNPEVLKMGKEDSRPTLKSSNSKSSDKKLHNMKTDKAEVATNPSSTESHPYNQAGQSVLSFSEFFNSLLTFDSDGRIIANEQSLQFLMLNSSKHFSPLVKSAR